ncbi:MAG: zinc ribbon domain-containing protein [Pseudomonadota bacterium]|nr:zinc ribbon domain-containing protein [Pseudomonadota bacterium]
MPIYEYRCASCGHEVETLQKLSDAPLSVCPACHKAELKKQVSAAGFQLKGSGWYVTDFRNSGAKQPAKDKSANAEAKAGGGGEAKPEVKSSESSGGETKTTTTQTHSSDGASESKSTATTTATTTSGDKT